LWKIGLLMEITARDFDAAQKKTVDTRLRVGYWQVYPQYELWEREEDGEQYAYIEATPIPWTKRGKQLVPDRSGVLEYPPLRVSGLFLEFAKLFGDGQSFLDEAPPVVLDWVSTYGALGVAAWYPTRDGGWVSGRHDDRESVMQFFRLSVEANRCLSLFAAANAPRGPDVNRLQELGIRGETPRELAETALGRVDETISIHLENETCTRLYRWRDGTTFSGPGFHSLLGALWLQMSNLRNAPEEDIRRCDWCGDIITFEMGEPPPDDAPKGAHGKHKTHSNRRFCVSKNGVENKCKNDFNYAQRKRKHTGH
jgi:hypothetical protein